MGYASTSDIYIVMDKYGGGCFNTNFPIKPVSESQFKDRINDSNRDEETKSKLISDYSIVYSEYLSNRKKELAKNIVNTDKYYSGRRFLKNYIAKYYLNTKQDIENIEKVLSVK